MELATPSLKQSGDDGGGVVTSSIDAAAAAVQEQQQQQQQQHQPLSLQDLAVRSLSRRLDVFAGARYG